MSGIEAMECGSRRGRLTWLGYIPLDLHPLVSGHGLLRLVVGKRVGRPSHHAAHPTGISHAFVVGVESHAHVSVLGGWIEVTWIASRTGWRHDARLAAHAATHSRRLHSACVVVALRDMVLRGRHATRGVSRVTHAAVVIQVRIRRRDMSVLKTCVLRSVVVGGREGGRNVGLALHRLMALTLAVVVLQLAAVGLTVIA